ncbi:disease resistance protein [Salix suchowensis]|nr:disease resistance protein [Salix suchowensis]
MIRGSDPFWRHVQKMVDGSLKCVFCGSVFAKSTSISRIKYHLAGVKGGGVKLCEKVTPDVQRAAFDQLPNRMHVSMPSSSNNIIATAGSDRAQDLEMQGQPLLDDELSWMDSLIGGEIFLADENVAPVMPMPDAPETGLGTEPADQPFEMDMSNISSSLMQSVVERGSSSKSPVDRSVPSSSNNIIATAGSYRAQDLEMQGQPLLDDDLSWMDSLIGGEILLTDENVAPGMPMPDAPETGLGTEPADQPFEMDMKTLLLECLMQSVVERSVPSSSNNEATNAASTPVRGLAIEQPRLDDGLGWMDNIEEPELVEEPRAPVVLMTYEPETRQRTEQAPQSFEMNKKSISFSSMMDAFRRMSRKIMSRKYKHSAVERGSSSKRPVDRSVPSSSNNEATNAASTPVRGLDILIGRETDEPETRQRTEQAHQSLVDDVLRMCRNIMSQEYKYSVVERGSSSESPVHKRRRTRRYFLPTTKLVGQAFERNMNDVWSWLLNDEVSSIGIYGMGGVGKTAFATHIHNQLRHVCKERQDIFHHVCWITVSQDFSIEALQDCIANYFDLDLGDQKDAVVRAGMLLTELSVTKKYVLILDDLWDHFLLEKVGIPLRTDGCKLIFTTRSLDICKKMDCQRIIKVEPLSEGEAWNLFGEKLGHGVRLLPETKQIAKSVVKECAGLPLGIMTMAGSMKGVYDEYRWRDALLRLRIPEVGPSDMETEVFRVLKFSYAQLNDPVLQKCFLHITLFPKGKIILRKDLIEHLIDVGIIVEMWSRLDQFGRGHTMLDQLENASLLEGSRDDENYRYVKMHDLIWDMARRILNESLGGRVQAGAQLTELPDATWWRENLLIVSLMENRIKEIPSDFSPRCPNLSTLLLCRNYKLNLVESSFFQHFIRLEVLDLSDTDIEKLPDSICHLTSLTVLLLGWCAKLSYVPSLAELTALKKLDLSYTGLENLPEGMERLKDLRYLNLDGSEVRDLQPGILPELSKLQFLKLHQKFGVFLPVEGHEVSRLERLEILECNFRDLENFQISELSGLQRCASFFTPGLPQITCKVTVGRPSFSLLEDLNYTKTKSDLVTEAWFYDLMIDDASFLSQMSFRKVVFVNCQNMRILGPLKVGYRTLKILHLDGLMILETLFEAPSYRSPFFYLKEIVIHKCHRMKVLLPPWLLSTLLHLEVIVVEDCHNMSMIMGTDEEGRIHQMSLKVLVLKKLPNLNSIYSGRLECNSLEEITVYDCPQLTRIPLTIPHSLKKIQVDPESLRNSIEWGRARW